MSLRIVTAAPFRYTKAEKMLKSELTFFYTVEKKWMTSDLVRMFLGRAVKEGLLAEDNGTYKPLFDVSEVEIPLGYKPPAEVFEAEQNVCDALLEEIAEKRGASINEAAGSVSALMNSSFDGNIAYEAALIIEARRCGADFSPKLKSLYENMTAQK